MKTVGVIGAGTMGNGIAHVFAQFGFEVFLVDQNEEQLNTALSIIQKNFDRQVSKNVMNSKAAEEALSRISAINNIGPSLEGCGLIVEAVNESIDLKRLIFRELEHYIPETTVLASNTSSISITEIASGLKHPERVIGMHFMNPVPVMELVEIINAAQTLPKITELVHKLSVAVGKTPVSVNDYPGFISNRILMPMINEATIALYEGVSGVKEIDTIMQLGMAHKMGPLKLADFIGLDVCKNILDIMYKGFGNPKYSPSPLLKQMVNAGDLGVKSGKGFYDWSTNKKDPDVTSRFLYTSKSY